MTQLKLAFLGPPKIYHAHQALTFRTRKTLALLTYLVMERGMHSRERLTVLFWPESNQESGRATLRSTLLYLRQALNHDAPGMENNQPHLIIDRNAIGFEFLSDFKLDCYRLQNAVEAIDQEETDKAPDVRRLQQITESYQGDFLAGFSLPDTPEFDNWISYQRERWHLQISKVFDHLSHKQAEAGQIIKAIETVTRWLTFDPLNETVYRYLMQFRFATGDRPKALEAYNVCCQMLREEFQTEPLPETRALAERIRRATLPKEKVKLELTRRNASIQNLKLLEMPLVGRTTEFNQLVEAYHRAGQAHTQIVILEGEAGIGKTRLVNDFLAWTAAQGADIMQGKIFETGGSLPYQPVVDALRNRLEGENPSPDALLSNVWLAELSRLLPELYDRYPDLPAPTTEERSARTRMFEAVTRLGKSLTCQTTLVFFIDDLQWADTASLDLLHYTARRWTEDNLPLLIIFCLRSEILARAAVSNIEPSLIDWLNSVKRVLSPGYIRLDPLTLDDTKRLVQTLSGNEMQNRHTTDKKSNNSFAPDSSSDPFSQWLFAETHGHPFYMAETLKALLEKGLLVSYQHTSGERYIKFDQLIAPHERSLLQGYIAPGVRDIVRSRLSRLSSEAFNLLVAGAVIGHDFSFKQMCRIADLNETLGLAALDELLASRLLLETDKKMGATRRPYIFAHDKIRDVVYTEAGDARRHLFHERAFTYLQTISAPAVELVHQALATGLSEAAYRYSMVAADEAMELFAVRDAIQYYEQARQITAEDPQINTILEVHQRRHLYDRLGRAYEFVNMLDMAQAVYEEMRTISRKVGEPTMEGAALTRLATMALHQHIDAKQAKQLLEEAKQVAEINNDMQGLIEVEWNLSQTSFYLFDPEAALIHSERALKLARELGQKDLIARSLNALAYAKAGVTSRMKEVKLHAEEAQSLYAAIGNRAMEIDCIALVGTYHIHVGQPRAGIKTLRQAHALSLKIDNPWGQVNTLFHLVQGYLECGLYEKALDLINSAVKSARLNNINNLLANVLITRGVIYRVLQRFEEAHTDHLEAETILKEAASPHLLSILAVHQCADHVMAGIWPRAHEYAIQASDLADFSRVFTWFYAGFDYWTVIEALVQGGDIELAQQNTVRLGEAAGDNPRYQIPYLRALAILAQKDNNMPEAISHLEVAKSLTEEFQLSNEHWQILVKLGALYHDTGDEDKARNIYNESIEIVQSIANKIDKKELRQSFFSTEIVQHMFGLGINK